MVVSAKDAVKQYKVELLRELPLEEAIFFAMAEKANLFPLGIGDSIRAEKTRADKVAYFLQYVVEPAAEFYLPKLLEVMKDSKVANVEKLADDIQAATEPGVYVHMYQRMHIHVYNYKEYTYVLFIHYFVCMYVYIRMYIDTYVNTYVV